MSLEKEVLKESARIIGRNSFEFSKSVVQGAHCLPTWLTYFPLQRPYGLVYTLGNILGFMGGSIFYEALYFDGKGELLLIPLFTNLISGSYELYQYSENKLHPKKENKYERLKHIGGD